LIGNAWRYLGMSREPCEDGVNLTLTEKLQQKLTAQCLSFLDNTKTAILNGEEGLISSLNKSVSVINESYTRVINSTLK
jgi:hypothetical protein